VPVLFAKQKVRHRFLRREDRFSRSGACAFCEAKSAAPFLLEERIGLVEVVPVLFAKQKVRHRFY